MNKIAHIFLLLFLSINTFAGEILIDDAFSSVVLTKEISFCKDIKVQPIYDLNYINKLTFSNKGIPLKDSTGAFWIRIPIKNNTRNPIDLVLETNRFEALELFYSDENNRICSVKSGVEYPFKERELIKGDLSILPFVIPAKKKTNIYLWVHQPMLNRYQYSEHPLTLKKLAVAKNDLITAEHILFFFLGAIILMTLYNFALFIVLKKIGYLYYILNNISILLFVLAQVGKIDVYFFDSPKHHEKTILVLGNISFIFFMLFSKRALNFKKYDPKVNRIINYSLLIWPALLFFVFGGYEKIAVILGSLGAFAGYFIIIFSCIKAIRNGSKSILYFFAGNLFYFSAIIIQIAQVNQVLPYQIGVLTSLEIVEIGCMLQLALFSLTLGSSINIIRRKLLETEIEKQKQKQEEQIKLSRVIREKNIELERKVIERTNELRENSVLLSQRNRDINDSLQYARKIQNAFIPDTGFWKSILPNSYFIYEPKEVISGDFYWVTEKNNRKYFAVADCTGHGIPGAMVSIIGVNNLHRCINEFKLIHPSEILDKLHLLIQQSFESKINAERIKDGMDIAICCLYSEEEKLILEYAGANNPLWVLRSAEQPAIDQTKKTTSNPNATILYEIAANKQPIGSHFSRKPFDNHRIEVFKGDEIHLFTDGITDQFGGPDNKKFKRKKLRDEIAKGFFVSLEEKKDLILDQFKDWKGDEEQVDDVCIACVKV